jgi:hypothetical protein
MFGRLGCTGGIPSPAGTPISSENVWAFCTQTKAFKNPREITYQPGHILRLAKKYILPTMINFASCRQHSPPLSSLSRASNVNRKLL